MYQYSLTYFARLFNSCIENSEKRDDLQERLNLLMDNITFEIFANICRGLFESHKLMFSFLIATQIMINAGDISQVRHQSLCSGAAPIYRCVHIVMLRKCGTNLLDAFALSRCSGVPRCSSVALNKHKGKSSFFVVGSIIVAVSQ